MKFLDVKMTSNMKSVFDHMQKELKELPDEAYKVFLQNTPVRSGNAKRRTKLVNKKEIKADYAYAEKLDEGYSKQSPKGMVDPTTDYLEKEFIKIMTGKK